MNKKDILTFKEVLTVFEKRSRCARLKVAALLIKDSRIVSTGWNGVPAGKKHCDEIFDCAAVYVDNEERERHHLFAEVNELHAEVNCIGYAARNGISTTGCSMFVSISPCVNCAKLLLVAGVKDVFYVTKYDRNIDGLKLLEDSGVFCYQI